MEPIRSLRNQAVVEAGRLHRARERKRLRLTLIEGPHNVAEAVRAGADIRTVFALSDDPSLERWPGVRLVDEQVMKKLSGTAHPRGPVAVMGIPDPRDPAPDRDTLVLWGLSDPGNVGTIIRTAAAFGLAVVIGPRTCDPWAPKVLRSGAGAHFRLRLGAIEDPADLGERLAATVVEGGVPPAELGPGPWQVLIGSESHGLDPMLQARVAERVTIPMPGGTESLNAAVAASIIAYELGSRHH